MEQNSLAKCEATELSHTAGGSIAGPHRGELLAISSKAEPLPTLGHNLTFSLLLLLLFRC